MRRGAPTIVTSRSKGIRTRRRQTGKGEEDQDKEKIITRRIVKVISRT